MHKKQVCFLSHGGSVQQFWKWSVSLETTSSPFHRKRHSQAFISNRQKRKKKNNKKTEMMQTWSQSNSLQIQSYCNQRNIQKINIIFLSLLTKVVNWFQKYCHLFHTTFKGGDIKLFFFVKTAKVSMFKIYAFIGYMNCDPLMNHIHN